MSERFIVVSDDEESICFKICLKDGEYFGFSDILPKGFGYSVVEEDVDETIDYSQYYTTDITAGKKAKIDNSKRTVTNNNIVDANEEVTFVNSAISTEVAVPTGIRLDIAPYIIVLFATIGGAIVLLIIHRRKKQ